MTLFGKIIAGFLIIGGVGTAAYFMKDSSSSPASLTASTSEQFALEEQVEEMVVSTGTPTSSSKKMAFSQFMKTDKGSYVCEVNQNVGGISTKGKIYLSNGKVRGEFATNAAGQNIISSMVIKDGYSYTWTSMSSTMGFKVKLPSEVEVNQNSSSTQGSYAWNADTIGDYSCEVIAVDESRFTVPVAITFTEVNR